MSVTYVKIMSIFAKVRCKCLFRNEKTQLTNESDRLKTKSAWSPPFPPPPLLSKKKLLSSFVKKSSCSFMIFF